MNLLRRLTARLLNKPVFYIDKRHDMYILLKHERGYGYEYRRNHVVLRHWRLAFARRLFYFTDMIGEATYERIHI